MVGMSDETKKKMHLTKFLTAYAAYVVTLHTVPGPWQQWKRGKFVDMWTLTHIAWSMVGKRMGVPLPTMMALSVANEIGEAWIRRNRKEWLWAEPESITNIATDIAANYVGYKL